MILRIISRTARWADQIQHMSSSYVDHLVISQIVIFADVLVQANKMGFIKGFTFSLSNTGDDRGGGGRGLAEDFKVEGGGGGRESLKNF